MIYQAEFWRGRNAAIDRPVPCWTCGAQLHEKGDPCPGNPRNWTRSQRNWLRGNYLTLLGVRCMAYGRNGQCTRYGTCVVNGRGRYCERHANTYLGPMPGFW